MKKKILFIVLLLLPYFQAFAQRTDANIVGHVVAGGEHLPFANVFVKGTTIGTTTDETGHFQLINLPEGAHTIRVQMVGYKAAEKSIAISANQTRALKFELQQDILGLEEVVVTGDMNPHKRRESAVIVNSLTQKLFSRTQSVSLKESLDFCPGLRTETNCQNCGFSQLRMNGMEGPYSQVLINSRPIFSSLAGVYGLELIPTNMIERVEVVRGGGSALYGSNAIAGTVNLILKNPNRNSYEMGINSGLAGVGMKNSGNLAQDYSLNFNSSVVSSDSKTGMSIFGFYRNRQPFDANGDDFSELAQIKNTTVGSRIFHRFGHRNKLSLDLFAINEDRRGGNRFDYPLHEADIAESVKHKIGTAALTYDQFFRKADLLSVYASAQHINRDSYYGAERSLSDYGTTKNLSYNAGSQYAAKFENSTLNMGVEFSGANLNDKKLGYQKPDGTHTDNTTIADQTSQTIGIFSQYELELKKWKFSAGARLDHYRIEDLQGSASDKNGEVLSPRLSVKHDLFSNLQVRLSYAQGYRAPQIFDEDLHIESSGSRQVIHRNAPELKVETSHSYMASLNFTQKIGNWNVELLAEGFYTQLKDAFANEFGEPDASGTVVYTRVNAAGASVQGINFEIKLYPSSRFTLQSGFTLQRSLYDETQEFDEKRFFRTPNDYGYFSLNYEPTRRFGASLNGIYTGKMLVPHFGETEQLHESQRFLELDTKLRYKVRLNGASIEFFAGVKNILNSYQSDFDSGIDRDPGYIYGPGLPRTVFAGIKIGNTL